MTNSMRLDDTARTADSAEYACLFCVTGREETVVRDLLRDGQVNRAMTARTVRRRTHRGKTVRLEENLLPGYVFVEARSDFSAFSLRRADGVIATLYSTDRSGKDWKLYGSDRAFAQWLFTRNGLLEFSKAYREGDRVRIISGPLKDLEGSILKVDKRNTSGRVALNLGGRTFTVWLGFDIVEKPL